MNKTDMQLKQDIEAELGWDPKVNAAQIGVSVDKGAVSLLGAVDTYAEKWAAEEAIKRVSGVRSVAQELTVKDLQDSVDTSLRRYRGGITTYLEVLEGQQSLFTAELTLAQARGNEYQSLVQLYKALGGGWQ